MSKFEKPDHEIRIFISYSRADAAFADEIFVGLQTLGYMPHIDHASIAVADDWQARLRALISEAETIVFVISPDSLMSDTCAWELRTAVELSKRLVPVLWRTPGEHRVPSVLSALNYVRFDEGRSFAKGLAALDGALRIDLAWLRDHSRYLLRAQEWEAGGKPNNRLLSGSDIDAMKDWAARRPTSAPTLTPLQLDFLQASEAEEKLRALAAAAQVEERERLLREAESAARAREAAVHEAEEAVRREKAAQDARLEALQAAAASARTTVRAQRRVGVLLVGVVLSLLGILYKEPLEELWFRATTLRDYVRREVTPYVLADAAEKSLLHGGDFRECRATCPQMVVVGPGAFWMGAPDDGIETEAKPRRKVDIPRAFAVGKHEVTWAEWDVCVAMRGCDGRPTSDATFGKGDRPVINVSWHQATQYAGWLARVTGKPYRLLTEAEWEYAARGIRSADAPHPAYSWGDVASHDFANYGADVCCAGAVAGRDQWLYTAPVEKFPANAFGLHDMLGNVFEWVQDPWHPSFSGNPPTDGSAWLAGGDPKERVVRGGAWNVSPAGVTVTTRVATDENLRNTLIGIRVGRSLTTDLKPGK